MCIEQVQRGKTLENVSDSMSDLFQKTNIECFLINISFFSDIIIFVRFEFSMNSIRKCCIFCISSSFVEVITLGAMAKICVPFNDLTVITVATEFCY